MKNQKEFIRFGKPSKEVISQKLNFFENNDSMLSIGSEMNKLYSCQPKRDRCKNCDSLLGGASFTKLYVEYTICAECEHLNGLNQDTDLFCSKVYTDNKGSDYSKVYNSVSVDAYKKRVDDIYKPKALFLRDALEYHNIQPGDLTYADIGAGSGYFVSAMKDIGLVNSSGYEVSEQQVSFGNTMIGKSVLKKIDLIDTINLIKSIDADVISMIGVLEHVQQPREILKALQENGNIKYFYISVPLFSLSVFFEMIFPNVMNRQLSGAHTHLYTKKSLEYMANEFGLTRVASWWFGTDMVDLYRSALVSLPHHGYDENIMSLWSDKFEHVIDSLQLELDEKNLSSEVHMLFSLDERE
jgi:hypothetical protein